MQKCKYADKYKAMFPPKCNNGKGCETCRMKWQAKNRATMARIYRIQGKTI